MPQWEFGYFHDVVFDWGVKYLRKSGWNWVWNNLGSVLTVTVTGLINTRYYKQNLTFTWKLSHHNIHQQNKIQEFCWKPSAQKYYFLPYLIIVQNSSCSLSRHPSQTNIIPPKSETSISRYRYPSTLLISGHPTEQHQNSTKKRNKRKKRCVLNYNLPQFIQITKYENFTPLPYDKGLKLSWARYNTPTLVRPTLAN